MTNIDSHWIFHETVPLLAHSVLQTFSLCGVLYSILSYWKQRSEEWMREIINEAQNRGSVENQWSRCSHHLSRSHRGR